MQMATLMDFDVLGTKVPVSPFLHQLKLDGSQAPAFSLWGTPVSERVKELYQPYRDTHLWVEPFVGAGGMLLEVQPEGAICFDFCPEVAGLHQWLRDGGQYILPVAGELTPDNYYYQRLRFQALQSEYQASPDFVDPDVFFSLMIWLNKTCFNGLWRVNGDGFFNVPEGKDSKGDPHNPPDINLGELQQAYRDEWFFLDGDFEMAERKTSDPAFYYCDPPYFGTHNSYTPKNFTWDDQKRLAHWLVSLDAPVVVSNSNHAEIVKLYEDLGFQIEFIEVRRSISCKGGNRAAATELLATRGIDR